MTLEHVLDGRVLHAGALGDGRVGDLAVGDVHAGLEAGQLSRSRPTSPWSASASTYGSVALVSAKVEVTGTAPGMFATQ